MSGEVPVQGSVCPRRCDVPVQAERRDRALPVRRHDRETQPGLRQYGDLAGDLPPGAPLVGRGGLWRVIPCAGFADQVSWYL